MPTQISPMLAVSDGSAAVDFYKKAFGAELHWILGEGANVVAGLSVDGASFFLAHEAPEYGTRGPSQAGFTTVRIELFVEDPVTRARPGFGGGSTAAQPRPRTPTLHYRSKTPPADAAGRDPRSLRPYLADRQIPGLAIVSSAV